MWGYEVSMVNLYVMMKRYCEMKGVPVPWNHHDWNKAIGYAHLDPHEYWPRRNKSSHSTATEGSTAAASTTRQPELNKKGKPILLRGPRLDSSALLPTRGSLKCHLDHDTRVHMPEPHLTLSANCALHRWAHREMHPATKETGKNLKPPGLHSHVMHCAACDAHLCLNCWALFHKEKYLKQHVFDILKIEDKL